LALGRGRLLAGLTGLRRDSAVFRAAHELHKAEAAELGMTRSEFRELFDQALVKQLLWGMPAMFYVDRALRLLALTRKSRPII
jgi:hypothetical protein